MAISIIDTLKQILFKTNWTQSELAEQLGVTFATVNRWLNGHTAPHLAQVRMIERLYRNVIGVIPLSSDEIQKSLELVNNQRKKFKNIWKFLNNQDTIQEFLLELTYHTDAIEGNTLTKKETESILFDQAKIADKSMVEHLEAINHAAILKQVFSGKIACPISESVVKSLHKMLMQGIRDDAGEYAQYPRAIRGVDLVLPHPEDIPDEMKSFLKRVNRFEINPIEHIAHMHAEFEAIHPFGDGNGRVGRLIMIIQLLNQGFAPCLITVNQRAKYYEFLEYAQKNSVSHLTKFLADSIVLGYQLIEKYR